MDSFNKSYVDPEPWRCRRTDGKRWRCYLDALVHEKYCERHMHRGSQRSRKHVEVSKVYLGSNDAAKVSTGLHLGVPSSDFSRGSNMNFPTGPGSFSCKSIADEKRSNSVQVHQRTIGSSLGALASQDNGKNGSSYVNGKAFSFDQRTTGQRNRCNQQNEKNPDVPVVLEFGSSPKSVFGSCIGTSFNFHNEAGKGTETLRCQRTDGKRWQCKKKAITNKRYCETHIHRGAKRSSVLSKMNDTPTTVSAGTPSSCDMPKTSENYQHLNTDLTISIAENSGHKSVNSYSNSSSDATTITDENVTVCYM